MEKFWQTLIPTSCKSFGNAWKQPEHAVRHTPANSRMAAAEAADQQHVRPNAQPPRRPAAAFGLREREVPKSLGVLEQRDGDVHDCGRSLYARMWVLRGDHGKTAGA